jgi:quercetin dioxygenase-like cupin family protein
MELFYHTEKENQKPMPFKCVHSSEIKLEKPVEPGASGITVRWLITQKDGAPNFAMRLFELQPKGYSPLHSHDWEHEVYILEGNCKITCEDQEAKAPADYVVFIPPKTKHQFTNTGKSTLKFLCIIPHHR